MTDSTPGTETGPAKPTPSPETSERTMRRKPVYERQDPPWIISMTDLMMLLLTFFITLVALSSVDERSRRVLVDSVSKVFGIDAMQYRAKARHGQTVDSREIRDPLLEELRLVMNNDDVRLRRSSQTVIISIGSGALFEPGAATLTPEGESALDRLLPYIMRLEYPMLVAGHSSPRMDEEGGISRFGLFRGFGATGGDTAWRVSLDRAQAVYRHYTGRGIDSAMLRMEAYGEHQPAFSNLDAEGRAKNRRVELVLDKRDPSLERARDVLRITPEPSTEYFFRDFRFDLDLNRPGAITPRLDAGGGE